MDELKIGDLVTILVKQWYVLKPVTWVGRRHAVAAADDEDDAYPVRIRTGAFGESKPQRDLLVTGEHSLLVDGRLIPARILVNGGSLIFDRSIQAYTYYHIELEHHGILLAENLPAESYLDTGNRGNFANADLPALRPDLAVNPAHGNWAVDAAAPLAVDRAAVESVWQRLRTRAIRLGLLNDDDANRLIAAPDLRLLTDTGIEIMPAIIDGAIYTFVLPAGVTSVRLRSRTMGSADEIGPFVDDRRKLGVAVGWISLWVGRRRQIVLSDDLPDSLPGWQAPEPGAKARWTNGDAELRLPSNFRASRPSVLRIEIVRFGGD